MKYDLVMVTTCVSDKYITNMINSVIDNNTDMLVLIVFLNQSDHNILYNKETVNTHVIKRRVAMSSLSNVRNIGLDILRNEHILCKHIMFPDDDSTFCDVFFKRYNNVVHENTNYLIDVLNYQAEGKYRNIKMSCGDIISPKQYHYAISVNMIISSGILTGNLNFDTNLGVGTVNGASEDCDFFVRVSELTPFYYENTLFNYHPKNITKFKGMSSIEIYSKLKSYSKGYIYFIRKHNFLGDFYLLLFRTFLAVIVYSLKLNFRMVGIYFKLFFFRISLFRDKQ